MADEVIEKTEREKLVERMVEMRERKDALSRLPCFKAKGPMRRELDSLGDWAALMYGLLPLLKELSDPGFCPLPQREREIRSLIWELLP